MHLLHGVVGERAASITVHRRWVSFASTYDAVSYDTTALVLGFMWHLRHGVVIAMRAAMLRALWECQEGTLRGKEQGKSRNLGQWKSGGGTVGVAKTKRVKIF